MIKIVLLLCCCTVLVPAILAQTTNCGIDWHPLNQVSPNGSISGRASVAIQGDTIHVVYWGGQKRLPYTRSNDGGNNWEAVRDLIVDTTMFPFEITNSFLAANSSRLFLFFNGGINGLGESPIFMMQSTDQGGSWTVPIAINSGIAPIRNVSVQEDTIAVLAFVQAANSEAVFRSTDAGATWSSTSVPFYTNDPRVALTHGWLHLAYTYVENGCSFEQWHRRSSDLGVTWSGPILISNCDNRSGSSPSIAATEDGNVYISWTDSRYGCIGFMGCSILFRRSTDYGVTWLNEQILTKVPWGDVSKLASFDSYVLATWAGGGGTESRLSIDHGATWSPLCTVVDTGGYPSNYLSSRSASVACDNPGKILVRSGVLPSVKVEEPSPILVDDFRLYEPFPNPFNSSTTLKYSLERESFVRIEVFNTLGQSVGVIEDSKQTFGEHYSQWDAKNHPTGVYIYRINAGANVRTGKLLLIR